MSKYFGNEQLPVFDGYSRTESDKRYLAPVFMVYWWPNRATIPAGYVAADGQLLNRKTFPHVITGIQEGIVPVIDDETWLNDPTKRGCYTLGDGSTNFRVPDYNGKSAGSLGAVFLRGDGEKSAGDAGVIQGDAYKSHRHTLIFDPAQKEDYSGFGSSFNVTQATGLTRGLYFDHDIFSKIVDRSQTIYSGHDGSNTSLSGGNETRPLNVTGCWVIKLFGEVVNVGSADAEQLASDYANLAGRVATLESRPSLGWGQTWQDVKAQRAWGTTYTNTTGRPIAVHIYMGSFSGVAVIMLTIDGVTFTSPYVENPTDGKLRSTSIFAIIPPGAVYKANGDYPFTQWNELR